MNTELSPKAAEIAGHASALLAAGGYNGFSYADLSALVNISKASIHHHFPSKAELVQVVVARYRQQARQGLAAMQQQIADPAGQLKAYADYWAQCLRDDNRAFCICAMLAAEKPAIPPEVADEVRQHFRDLAAWLASVLEQGAASGQFRLRGAPAAEADTLMATVHGAMLAARALDQPAMFPAVVQPALAALQPAV